MDTTEYIPSPERRRAFIYRNVNMDNKHGIYIKYAIYMWSY